MLTFGAVNTIGPAVTVATEMLRGRGAVRVSTPTGDDLALDPARHCRFSGSTRANATLVERLSHAMTVILIAIRRTTAAAVIMRTLISLFNVASLFGVERTELRRRSVGGLGKAREQAGGDSSSVNHGRRHIVCCIGCDCCWLSKADNDLLHQRPQLLVGGEPVAASQS